MKKTLFIFRHGETDWNLRGRMQGSIDIPLNETGRQQALKLNEFFKSHPVEVFLSSDLLRARQTAEIAAQDLGVPIVLEPLLRETHLGQVEGLTKFEVMEKMGQTSWDSWATSDPNLHGFRFPGGESKFEHLSRLLQGLEKFLRTTSYQRIAVSTHGGAMRRLIHHFRPELTKPVMVENCSVYEAHHELNASNESLWHIVL